MPESDLVIDEEEPVELTDLVPRRTAERVEEPDREHEAQDRGAAQQQPSRRRRTSISRRLGGTRPTPGGRRSPDPRRSPWPAPRGAADCRRPGRRAPAPSAPGVDGPSPPRPAPVRVAGSSRASRSSVVVAGPGVQRDGTWAGPDDHEPGSGRHRSGERGGGARSTRVVDPLRLALDQQHRRPGKRRSSARPRARPAAGDGTPARSAPVRESAPGRCRHDRATAPTGGDREPTAATKSTSARPWVASSVCSGMPARRNNAGISAR